MSAPVALDATLLRQFPLPHHPDDGDKGERGLALVIAGSRELSGAALLAGTGALRAGAGRLQVATADCVAVGVGIAIPEARVTAFAESDDGCIDPAAVEALAKQCEEVDSLAIGPGMRDGAALADLIRAVLARGGAYPLILDAAALTVLPSLAEAMRGWRGGAVLLPHAGEMAKLLDIDKEQVEAGPLAAAREASETFHAVALIKGEYSHIVAPDGRCFRYHGGGIGLATSGSGDVLAGIVGGLAARGADPLTATLWGVYLHGEAGRKLSREVGRVGFLARELLDHIAGLMV